MRAAVLNQIGGVPAPSEFPDPPSLEGHEVADVLIAGLNPNPVDLHIAAGRLGPVEVPCVVGREGIARMADEWIVYFSAPPAPYGSIAERARSIRRTRSRCPTT